MSDKIKVAIAGMGNVASTLAKGLEFYRTSTEGLWHPIVSGFNLSDIEIVAAYDIDSAKVGGMLYNVANFESSLPGITIKAGLLDDAVPEHISKNGQARTSSYEKFVSDLKESKADFLVNLISSGMDKTSEKYSRAALDAGCSFFNATSAKFSTENVIKAFV